MEKSAFKASVINLFHLLGIGNQIQFTYTELPNVQVTISFSKEQNDSTTV